MRIGYNVKSRPDKQRAGRLGTRAAAKLHVCFPGNGRSTMYDPRMTKKTSRRVSSILWGFALGLTALAVAGYWWLPGERRQGAASIGGAFAMTAQDGRTVTEKAFAGRPYLVFFGYTHCPDVCPTTLYDISTVFKAMGPDKKISALFVTIDPERDTPEVMKSYLDSFDPRIIGVSGDEARTEAITKAFKVYVKKVPGENGEYTVDHSAAVYLMDKAGRFVRAVNLAKPVEQVAREIERYL
jgi:protein SCO1/2